MKNLLLAVSCAFFLGIFLACSSNLVESGSGKISYELTYPDNLNNPFLIQILPKEMLLEFDKGVFKTSIRNANLQNLVHVDCNQKLLSFYFQYAEDAYRVNLNKQQVTTMFNSNKNIQVVLKDEVKKLAGFTCKKAVLVNKANGVNYEVWYTDEIQIKDPNWYTPFHEIKGVLMEYDLYQFGLHMHFKAKSFHELQANEKVAIHQFPKKGMTITYADYNTKMTNLFTTFER